MGILQPRPTTITQGILAWWTFDGGVGLDSSGRGFIGTLTNGPVPVASTVKGMDGQLGNALRFDGTNDYVIGPTLVNTALVTLSIWAKVNGAPAGVKRLCGFIDGIGSATSDKGLFVHTTGVAQWYVYDGAGKTTTGTKVITDNLWHHVVGVADGTNMTLYVDGVSDGTQAAGNTYTGYTVPNVFVNGADGVTAGYLAGDLDDFRLYNRGLSAAEVRAIYLEGIFGPNVQPIWPDVVAAGVSGRSILVNNPYAGRSILVNNESLAA